MSEAHALLSQSVTQARELRSPELVGYWQPFLALATLYLGDPAGARELLHECFRRLYLAARLASVQGAFERAAVLFGLGERVRRQMGYEPAGPVRLAIDRATGAARAALGPALFAQDFEGGEQTPLEEAYATIYTSAPLAAQVGANRPIALLGSSEVVPA